MGIFIKKKYFKPENDTNLIIAKTTNIKTEQTYFGIFFTVARTLSGARYYSETSSDYTYIYHIFSLYKDVVRYFGGGQVELYCITPEGYDILESTPIY